MLVLMSKSMATVRHYAEMDKVEIRRRLLEGVVAIKKREEG